MWRCVNVHPHLLRTLTIAQMYQQLTNSRPISPLRNHQPHLPYVAMYTQRKPDAPRRNSRVGATHVSARAAQGKHFLRHPNERPSSARLASGRLASYPPHGRAIGPRMLRAGRHRLATRARRHSLLYLSDRPAHFRG
jgi:hypothetical protein